MAECNYCTFQWLKRRAEKEGKVVTVIPSKSELGGVDVYVHSAKVIKPQINRNRHWKAWFMELTDECAC